MGSDADYIEFIIKPIKKGSSETKCQIKKICECSKGDFDEKLKEVKKPLIKNLQEESVIENSKEFSSWQKYF